MGLGINIFLLWGTCQDIKKKKINNTYLITGGILGGIFNIVKIGEGKFFFDQWLMALLPGVVFLIFAKMTGEKIGLGDGMVLLVLGNFCNIGEVCIILQAALMFLIIVSTVLWCSRKVSVDYRIPFLPFLWISHTILWRLGYV